jgi:hypothetical protein
LDFKKWDGSKFKAFSEKKSSKKLKLGILGGKPSKKRDCPAEKCAD